MQLQEEEPIEQPVEPIQPKPPEEVNLAEHIEED